jgi:hypothetical protein
MTSRLDAAQRQVALMRTMISTLSLQLEHLEQELADLHCNLCNRHFAEHTVVQGESCPPQVNSSYTKWFDHWMAAEAYAAGHASMEAALEAATPSSALPFVSPEEDVPF